MKVKVKLLDELKYFTNEKQEDMEVEISQGSTVEDMLKLLYIPLLDIQMVTVNGKNQPLSYQPDENDVIVLFPLIMGG